MLVFHRWVEDEGHDVIVVVRLAAFNRFRYRILLISPRDSTIEAKCPPKPMTWGPSMSQSGSVTNWIEGLKAGDQSAAQQIWNRYCQRLVGLARKKLGRASRRYEDEDDAVQKAFTALYLGARDGKFPLLNDRNDLWSLLVRITVHKAVDQIIAANRRKHGSGKVGGHSALKAAGSQGEPISFDDLMQRGPGPETLVIWREEFERMLGCLGDDTLRKIAELSAAGDTAEEIAEKLECARTTVFRKLRLIRKKLRSSLTTEVLSEGSR